MAQNSRQQMPPKHSTYDIGLYQGCYFIASAIWPFVSQESFEKITGPKHDRWLVKTVASLIFVIGAALLLPGRSPQRKFIGMCSALALGLIDVYFVSKRIIRKVYLADALAEAIFVSWWLKTQQSDFNRKTRTES